MTVDGATACLAIGGAGAAGLLALGGYELFKTESDGAGAGPTFAGASGTADVTLHAKEGSVDLGSRTVKTWSYDETLPGREVRVRQGDHVRVRVVNDLPADTSIHWHGVRLDNAMDGVPGATQKPIAPGESFLYDFVAPDAGTYMYHCHFEDVEHVTMGMTGLVFVRPAGYDAGNAATWKAYDAADTAYHVEYPILLTEFDFSGHWNDAHIMESDWTNYKPDIWLMNGRAYPDTLEPGTARDNATGDMEVPVASPHLQYQPLSSRLTATTGQQVLIRLANLGFEEQTLSMPGVPLRMVGNDARYMDAARQTVSDTVVLGAGESRDLILTAPAPGTYPFYNTDPTKYRGDGNDQRVGGQYTELVVSA